MGKPVDMAVVRSARRNLAQIAEEHPELLGQGSVEGWIGVLAEIEEADMGKTIQVGVRFPTEVVEVIDRFAADETDKLRASLPGLVLNRADAIRVLTVAALQARGYEVGGPDEPTAGAKAPTKARRKASK